MPAIKSRLPEFAFPAPTGATSAAYPQVSPDETRAMLEHANSHLRCRGSNSLVHDLSL